MTEAPESARPEISVLVPVVERSGDLASIYLEFSQELDRLGRSHEFLFVVDPSRDDCLPVLRDLKRRHGGAVTIIVFRKSFGEAAALNVAVDRARGDTLLTLAAYFQVGPEELGEALRLVESGSADLVVGVRQPRTDAWVNRLQAGAFHRLAGAMTGTRFTDLSCGFRVLKRETALELDLYGDLHRFIPILAAHRGFAVHELRMGHRQEDRSLRYASLGTVLRRLLDLLTVFFLIRFTRKPLRFFGLIGSAALAVGFGITLYLGLYRILGMGGIADRPLLLLGALLLVLGVQSISLGLLGEIIIFTHARRVHEYRIAEIL